MTNLSVLGFFIEFTLFCVGVYLYLYSAGFISLKGGPNPKAAEAWREENAWWLKYGGLALAAVMLANLVLRLAGK